MSETDHGRRSDGAADTEQEVAYDVAPELLE